VVGSTVAMFVVPLVVLLITTVFVALSFWPVLMVLLPFVAAGWALFLAASIVVAWVMRNEAGRCVGRCASR
jgi:hypothetical protein